VTGEQTVELVEYVVNWGSLALVLIVFIMAVAYVRGKRKP
jgi:hypothetical protein